MTATLTVHPVACRAATLALAAFGLLALCCGSAQAQYRQPGEPIGGIYTCTDAHGRRLNSDRPITECMDREQRELNRSGSTRRVLPPSLSPAEREKLAQQQREQRREAERRRSLERRDAALIARYPDRQAHEAGREEALLQTTVIVNAAEARISTLQAERKKLDEEMEFYSADPSKAPPQLRRAIEANEQAIAQQQQAIEGQNSERQRINAAFDEEVARLEQLWRERDAQ